MESLDNLPSSNFVTFFYVRTSGRGGPIKAPHYRSWEVI